jgi:hypothetical protein
VPLQRLQLFAGLLYTRENTVAWRGQAADT